MISAGETVRFKDSGYDREFNVTGVNDKGYDREAKRERRMLIVSFRGFNKWCSMSVPESEMEVVQ